MTGQPGDRVSLGSNGTSPGKRLAFYCLGCKSAHSITVGAPGAWTWDGELVHPTINPSVKVIPHKTLINPDLEGEALTAPENITNTPLCHSFIRNGFIEYLGDCTHRLAGETIELPFFLDHV